MPEREPVILSSPPPETNKNVESKTETQPKATEEQNKSERPKTTLLSRVKKWGLGAGFAGALATLGGIEYQLKDVPKSEAELKDAVAKADTRKRENILQMIEKDFYSKIPDKPEPEPQASQKEVSQDPFSVDVKTTEDLEIEREENELRAKEKAQEIADLLNNVYGDRVEASCRDVYCKVKLKDPVDPDKYPGFDLVEIDSMPDGTIRMHGWMDASFAKRTDDRNPDTFSVIKGSGIEIPPGTNQEKAIVTAVADAIVKHDEYMSRVKKWARTQDAIDAEDARNNVETGEIEEEEPEENPQEGV